MTNVILVDKNNQQIGICEKLDAHKRGLLHRAFSIFILNSKNELLLQQRAAHKYHTPLLWTNTCCSHPLPNESTLSAANRRLNEEMGLSAVLKEVFQFTYRAELANKLIEHEYDHVYIGKTDQHPSINKEEANDWKNASLNQISEEIVTSPELYTPWFITCFEKFKAYAQNDFL